MEQRPPYAHLHARTHACRAPHTCNRCLHWSRLLCDRCVNVHTSIYMPVRWPVRKRACARMCAPTQMWSHSCALHHHQLADNLFIEHLIRRLMKNALSPKDPMKVRWNVPHIPVNIRDDPSSAPPATKFCRTCSTFDVYQDANAGCMNPRLLFT